MEKNKENRFSWGDMPNEVFWAKTVGMQPDGSGGWIRMIGMSILEKIKEIQKKYPDWFPWETKYDSIPKEVHDAYYNEINPPIQEDQEQIQCSGGGILEEIKKMPELSFEYDPHKVTMDDLTQAIKMLNEEQEAQIERCKQLKARKAKEKKIWDKHYGKYGIEYRG